MFYKLFEGITGRMSAMYRESHLYTMSALLKKLSPKLHNHMNKLKVSWDPLFSKWIGYCFVNILDLSVSMAIWDIMLLDRSSNIVQAVSLAKFMELQEELVYDSSKELLKRIKSSVKWDTHRDINILKKAKKTVT